MIIRFNDYINEGINDILKPKPSKEIDDILKNMSDMQIIMNVFNKYLPKVYLPDDVKSKMIEVVDEWLDDYEGETFHTSYDISLITNNSKCSEGDILSYIDKKGLHVVKSNSELIYIIPFEELTEGELVEVMFILNGDSPDGIANIAIDEYLAEGVSDYLQPKTKKDIEKQIKSESISKYGFYNIFTKYKILADNQLLDEYFKDKDIANLSDFEVYLLYYEFDLSDYIDIEKRVNINECKYKTINLIKKVLEKEYGSEYSFYAYHVYGNYGEDEYDNSFSRLNSNRGHLKAIKYVDIDEVGIIEFDIDRGNIGRRMIDKNTYTIDYEELSNAKLSQLYLFLTQYMNPHLINIKDYGISEGVLNFLKPKSEEDIESTLMGLPEFQRILQIYSNPFNSKREKFLPENAKEIVINTIKGNINKLEEPDIHPYLSLGVVCPSVPKKHSYDIIKVVDNKGLYIEPNRKFLNIKYKAFKKPYIIPFEELTIKELVKLYSFLKDYFYYL